MSDELINENQAKRERDWSMLADQVVGGEINFGPIPPTESQLKSRIHQLEAEVAASKAKVDNLMECLKSECEIERMAKDAAKKVLTEHEVDGDSYGVPNVATIVDLLVARHNIVGMGLDAVRRENDTLRRALKIDPSEPQAATLEWVLAVNKKLREEWVAHLAVIEKAKVLLERVQSTINSHGWGQCGTYQISNARFYDSDSRDITAAPAAIAALEKKS